MKRLNELYDIDSTIEIKGIKINSKEIEPGDLFICTMGVSVDRHDFIEDAIKNGAVALVVSREVVASVPVIKVANTNQELPLLMARFYDHPEDKLTMIGVTGTNGKTTVALIIQDLLGKDKCGYIGTNGLIYANVAETIRNSTPDSDRLFPYFRTFVDNRIQYVSMETSSEAFYRKRLTTIQYQVSILTNITEDHLNIHKTLENYVSCKCELFKQTKDTGYAILNIDDAYYERVKSITRGTVLTYGKSVLADFRILDIRLMNNQTDITVAYKGSTYQIVSPLLGEFNVYNLSAAILAVIALGYDISTVLARITNITPINGRLESLKFGQKYQIILDYAHTTDALDKVLTYLGSVKKGRLITVTGAAGGREHEKRPVIGKIVLEKSDYVIFTSDDPRNEDVNQIIKDLIGDSKNTNYEIITDRSKAIEKALKIAEDNDIILLAGKGRDNYMAIGDEYLPYSEYDEVKKYMSN